MRRLLLTLAILSLPTLLEAQTISGPLSSEVCGTPEALRLDLAWDPSPTPGVTGYTVHIGTTPGTYQQSGDVGLVFSYVYTASDAALRCFAVSAYAPALPANTPPTVSLTAPTQGSAFSAPASVTLTAVATDSDGGITTVDFLASTGSAPLTLIGSDALAPFTLTLPLDATVPAGTYQLVAVATDTGGASTMSAPVVVTVLGPVSGCVSAPLVFSGSITWPTSNTGRRSLTFSTGTLPWTSVRLEWKTDGHHVLTVTDSRGCVATATK